MTQKGNPAREISEFDPQLKDGPAWILKIQGENKRKAAQGYRVDAEKFMKMAARADKEADDFEAAVSLLQKK